MRKTIVQTKDLSASETSFRIRSKHGEADYPFEQVREVLAGGELKSVFVGEPEGKTKCLSMDKAAFEPFRNAYLNWLQGKVASGESLLFAPRKVWSWEAFVLPTFGLALAACFVPRDSGRWEEIQRVLPPEISAWLMAILILMIPCTLFLFSLPLIASGLNAAAMHGLLRVRVDQCGLSLDRADKRVVAARWNEVKHCERLRLKWFVPVLRIELLDAKQMIIPLDVERGTMLEELAASLVGPERFLPLDQRPALIRVVTWGLVGVGLIVYLIHVLSRNGLPWHR